MKYLFIFFSVILLAACGQKKDTQAPGTTDGLTAKDSSLQQGIAYKFNNPDEIYTLPGSLQEISGMQMLNDNLIACIQDEEGILYLFSTTHKKVVKEIPWGQKGDYEGLTGNSQALYVLRSDGTIFKVSNYNSNTPPNVQRWKTDLDARCDAEGIVLLPDKNTLLVTCKGGDSGLRNIWAVDVQTQEMHASPYHQITQDMLESKMVTDGLDQFLLSLKKTFDIKGESGILAPSGLAVHPVTKDLYIISANSKLLLVFAPTGELKFVKELPASLFIHPESITFTAAGDMLVGNEGKGTKPSILYFKYDK